jgi:DNA polymerase-3 subunit delta
MSIKGFFEELKKGLKAPAYLLYSGEKFLLKEALFSIKNTIPETERDFLFNVFDTEDAVPVEQIVDILYTVPFIGGRKIVVVENSQKFSDSDIKKLARYISEPSPDSVLVLLNSSNVKKSHREALKGAKLIPLEIREKELPFWIKEKASRKGLILTADAVEYLIGTVGPDAGVLSSEVEKLTLAGKKTLDADDIREIVKGSGGGYDVFDLIDALKRKNAEMVFRIYKTLSETQEPSLLLGALNWHYGRLPESWKEKTKVFALLNEADIMIKSSGGAFPLEYLLVRLLQL